MIDRRVVVQGLSGALEAGDIALAHAACEMVGITLDYFREMSRATIALVVAVQDGGDVATARDNMIDAVAALHEWAYQISERGGGSEGDTRRYTDEQWREREALAETYVDEHVDEAVDAYKRAIYFAHREAAATMYAAMGGADIKAWYEAYHADERHFGVCDGVDIDAVIVEMVGGIAHDYATRVMDERYPETRVPPLRSVAGGDQRPD